MKSLYTILIMLFIASQAAMAQVCTDPAFAKQLKYIRQLSNRKELNAGLHLTDSLLRQAKHQSDTTCLNYYSLLSLKGLILIRKDNTGEALILFSDLVSRLKSTSYKDLEAQAYLSLALIHELMHRPEACAQNLKIARSITDRYQLKETLTRLYVRTASYYLQFRSDPDSCMYYSQLALKYSPYTTVLNDVGDTYGLLGMCTPSSIDRGPYLEKAIQTFNKSEDWIASAFLSFGIYQEMLNQNRKPEAEVYLDSIKIKYLDRIRENSLEKSIGLAIYYEKKKDLSLQNKDYKKALQYEELYSQHRRDYADAKNQTYLSKLQDEFLFEKEQRKSKSLEDQSKVYRNILLLSLLFIAALSVLLYINNRNKQKIKRQKDIIEKSMVEVQNLSHRNELLLTEAHHRINNSLQNVIAILQIQKEKVDVTETKELLNDLSNRIKCISLIHEQIHKNQQSENINLAQFITTILELLNQLSVSWDLTQSKIDIDNSIFINNETAMPLGIITNELVTNTLKHANLPDDALLIISLQISKGENGIYLFDYADNGEQKSEPRSGSSLGFMLIHSMVKQLNSHWEYSMQNGFHASFEFKIKNTSVV
ncbi:MAG: sensor histidine kinase [Saprospiraceae bacterium]|nr:sensor histidine kinase [Saprospiraceae bacterium]